VQKGDQPGKEECLRKKRGGPGKKRGSESSIEDRTVPAEQAFPPWEKKGKTSGGSFQQKGGERASTKKPRGQKDPEHLKTPGSCAKGGKFRGAEDDIKIKFEPTTAMCRRLLVLEKRKFTRVEKLTGSGGRVQTKAMGKRLSNTNFVVGQGQTLERGKEAH